MRRIVFDLETRNEVSVVDVGAWKYAAHPSNEWLCVSWRLRENREPWSPVYVAICCPGSDGRAAIERRVREKGFLVASLQDFIAAAGQSEVFVCHNVAFERAQAGAKLPGIMDLEPTWSCTAARARRLSLPGSLEWACKALNTPHQKSEEGHRIMLQVSQPRPTWNRDPTGPKWYEDAERLAACAVYCAEDILAESDLDDVLPELSEFERSVWDQVERANRTGLKLDVELIGAMEKIVAKTTEDTLAAIRRETGDYSFSLTNPSAIREFCARHRVFMDDLRAETVEAILAKNLSGTKRIPDVVRRVLEGRQMVGKSSNAKLPAMRDRLQEDDRARDYAMYHGAHTGRQTGAKVNPLNMPRPWKGYDQDKVLAALKAGDLAAIDAMGVSPSKAVSASLRGTIVAGEGKKFVIGDYATIEPCCLFTLAGQTDAVQILREKGDIYCEMSSAVYSKRITKEDKQERMLGKALVLGCGYGMGEDKFIVRLELDGLNIPEGLARASHGTYRTKFPMVKKLWDGLGAAAIAAVRDPHTAFTYGRISYVFDGWWLVCTLPNGRPLFYPEARVQPGKYSDELVYSGRHTGGAWGSVRTWGGSLAENLCQAISRDITMRDKLEVERQLGWNVVLDVYDEIVAECPVDTPNAPQMLEHVMARSPEWLSDMPVYAECFEAERYRKE